MDDRSELSERKSNEWVRNMLALMTLVKSWYKNRLKWFGHVER